MHPSRARAPLPTRVGLDCLPTLVFDRIVDTCSNSMPTLVAVTQVSRALRGNLFEARLHALTKHLCILTRDADAAGATLPLSQVTFLRAAKDLAHLVSMVHSDMGLRPRPCPTARLAEAWRHLGTWWAQHDPIGDHRSKVSRGNAVCEGVTIFTQDEVEHAKCGVPYRQGALTPILRGRLLALAQLGTALQRLGPDVLRLQLQPWAHDAQCRRGADAQIAVECMVRAWSTGSDYLDLSRLQLASLPPYLAAITTLRWLDAFFNTGVMQRPTELIESLKELRVVSYSHWQETLRPGRRSRFLDLNDIDVV